MRHTARGLVINEKDRTYQIVKVRVRGGNVAIHGAAAHMLTSRHGYYGKPSRLGRKKALFLFRDGDPRPLILVRGDPKNPINGITPDPSISDREFFAALTSDVATRALKRGLDAGTLLIAIMGIITIMALFLAA